VPPCQPVKVRYQSSRVGYLGHVHLWPPPLLAHQLTQKPSWLQCSPAGVRTSRWVRCSFSRGRPSSEPPAAEGHMYLCGTGGTSRVPGLAPVMTFSTPWPPFTTFSLRPRPPPFFLAKTCVLPLSPPSLLLVCLFAIHLDLQTFELHLSLPRSPQLKRDHPKIPKARHAASSTLASRNDKSHPDPCSSFPPPILVPDRLPSTTLFLGPWPFYALLSRRHALFVPALAAGSQSKLCFVISSRLFGSQSST